MNFLDFAIVAAILLAAWAGYRVGFTTRALSWAGLAAGIVFAVEVVGHLLPVGAAEAPHHLPPGLGAQQVDIAPAGAVAAVEPVLDPFRHDTTLEHMCDYSPFCG